MKNQLFLQEAIETSNYKGYEIRIIGGLFSYAVIDPNGAIRGLRSTIEEARERIDKLPGGQATLDTPGIDDGITPYEPEDDPGPTDDGVEFTYEGEPADEGENE